MPIPGPGVAISIQTIVNEFGGTAPHSLSEYYRGGGLVPNTPVNAAVPTSGQIALSNFYGAANRTTISIPIAAPALNYDAYTNRGPTYVAGSSDLTYTIAAPVTIGSTSTATAAFLVPSAFNPGDTVTIVNNGIIQGMGGAGGAGARTTVPLPALPGSPGLSGGTALSVARSTTVTNNGALYGGGGGGGGGGSPSLRGAIGAGGGGGGAGTNGGAGGAGGPPGGNPGAAGTATGGGAGGVAHPPPGGGAGGPGGGRGAAGTAGGNSPVTPNPGGSGGAAGNYISGNPFVTWPATGTRLGGVA